MNRQNRSINTCPWVLSMKWHDVLFLHWPVSAEKMNPHIPDGLEIETFDGTSWLGIVPFTMSGIRPRFVPPLPYVSAFPELNIRTYVTDGTHSGVWFFSLDAASLLAVKMARLTYSLDYYHAEMNATKKGEAIKYSSDRKKSEHGQFQFDGSYSPKKRVGNTHGEFEDFLTERYYLFSADSDETLYRGAIDHDQWELFEANYTLNQLDIEDHPEPPDESPVSVLYSPYQDVRAWLPRKV